MQMTNLPYVDICVYFTKNLSLQKMPYIYTVNTLRLATSILIFILNAHLNHALLP